MCGLAFLLILGVFVTYQIHHATQSAMQTISIQLRAFDSNEPSKICQYNAPTIQCEEYIAHVRGGMPWLFQSRIEHQHGWAFFEGLQILKLDIKATRPDLKSHYATVNLSGISGQWRIEHIQEKRE